MLEISLVPIGGLKMSKYIVLTNFAGLPEIIDLGTIRMMEPVIAQPGKVDVTFHVPDKTKRYDTPYSLAVSQMVLHKAINKAGASECVKYIEGLESEEENES